MSWFYYCCQSMLFILAKLFFRHQIYYIEKDNIPEGAIIASNHASFMDPPLIALSWKDPIHFLANDYLFKNFFFRLLIENLNAHPVKRSNEIASIKLVCSLLGDKKNVLIFPEGTRSENGEFLPFKKGIGVLAMRTQCAVIPTYVHGSYDILPRGSFLPRFFKRKTACVFGKPILLEEFSNLHPKSIPDELAKRTQQEIIKLKEFYETKCLK